MAYFVLGFLAAALASTSSIDETAFAAEDVIIKDVAIIGGGASGTYAAVRLREDLDTSIVIVEQEDSLVWPPKRAFEITHR